MIKIEGLKKVYNGSAGKVLALEGVNLHVKRGEIYGIIGLSGAGKSTLIRCINRLENPTEGSILIDGQDITKLKEQELRAMRQKIGMIFQQFNLLWSRTVEGNIAFPLEIAGVPKDQIKIRVAELLELVGLPDKAKAYPSQLSGGQKQRVGIARALANNPKVLLCDEATSALDPKTTKSILELLKDINKRLNLTIVLITHEMNVIKEICDSVAVIDDARIVESGSVLEVFTRPKTQTARNFVSSIFNTEVPEIISTRANGKSGSKLIRVSFIGETAGKPIISDLVLRYQLSANILYGNIDHIKDTTFGSLTIEITGEEEAIGQALAYLVEQNLQIEELGV